MRVDQSAVYVSMSEQLLDMENVFGFMVFCSGSPMSKGVEGYLLESGVLQFLSKPVALLRKVPSVSVMHACMVIYGKCVIIISNRAWSFSWQKVSKETRHFD